MKHGVAFRKFSRTSSHRMLMLRNLVSSLLEHEQIKTTLPKAKDAARLAEKIITMAKKGDQSSQQRAASILLKPSLFPKLFDTFARRYADRQGGYTRIHKFGHRRGDNAPQAILELVDNPRDLRFELTSRAIGWELLREKLKQQAPLSLVNSGVDKTQALIQTERSMSLRDKGILRPKTRWNLQKVLKFRERDSLSDMSRKVGHYVDHLLATPMAFKTLYEEQERKTSMKAQPPRPRPGQGVPGETRSALDLAQGDLGHQRPVPRALLTMRSMFGRKYRSS